MLYTLYYILYLAMPFLDTIDQISFGKIFSLAVFLALLFGLPSTVLLVQQKTKISSRAYQKPELMFQKPEASSGVGGMVVSKTPADPPEIGRVFPWVGKVGDIIWLQGKNFGENPASRNLTIGGVKVTEEDIDGWRDDQIQAVIPLKAKQGGTVEVQIGRHPSVESLPIVIYDKNVKIKLHKKENLIVAINGGEIVKVKAWTGDENIETEMVEGDIAANPSGETPVFDTKGLPLLTLLLFDSKDNILPYYVDPIEWGF